MSFGKFTRQEIIDLISGSWSPYWGSGGGTPGGIYNSVQFNDNGTFSGSSNLTYYPTGSLNVVGNLSYVNFTPLDIPNLAVWLPNDFLSGNNLDTITSWYSYVDPLDVYSGQALFYTASFVTSKGNIKALRVDANTYNLFGYVSYKFTNTSASLFVVYSPKSDYYNVYSTDSPSVYDGLWRETANGSGSINLFTTNKQSGYPTHMPATSANGYIASVISKDNYYEFFNNGVSSGSINTSLFDPGYTVHMLGYTTSTLLSGNGDVDIAEVIIFNSELSTVDREKVEGYLAWKFFGATNPLPIGHPYKNTEPFTTVPQNLVNYYSSSVLLSYINSSGSFQGTSSYAITSSYSLYISSSNVYGPYGFNSVLSASHANVSDTVLGIPGVLGNVLFNNGLGSIAPASNIFVVNGSSGGDALVLSGSEIYGGQATGQNSVARADIAIGHENSDSSTGYNFILGDRNSLGFGWNFSILGGKRNSLAPSNYGAHGFIFGLDNTGSGFLPFFVGEGNIAPKYNVAYDNSTTRMTMFGLGNTAILGNSSIAFGSFNTLNSSTTAVFGSYNKGGWSGYGINRITNGVIRLYTLYLPANPDQSYMFPYPGTAILNLNGTVTLQSYYSSSYNGSYTYIYLDDTSINVTAVDYGTGDNLTQTGVDFVGVYNNTTLNGTNSAPGYFYSAQGNNSFIAGKNNISYNDYGHISGLNSVTFGQASHAEGINTTTKGNYSHVEGSGSVSYGIASHASGIFIIASGSGQTAVGKYNLQNNTSDLFVVGDGTNNSNRHDVLNVSSGLVRVTGSLNVSSSLTVIGQETITGSLTISGSDTVAPLIITATSTPPAVAGGIYFDGTDFYLGFA